MSQSEMALTTCNVPWKNTLSMETLLEIIDGKCEIGEWAGQICVLLNEVHPSVLTGLANENGFSISKLADLFRKLPPVFQSAQAKSFFDHGIIMDGKYC